VGVGDVVPNTGFISCVDSQPIALDVDPSFVELKFPLPTPAATFLLPKTSFPTMNRPHELVPASRGVSMPFPHRYFHCIYIVWILLFMCYGLGILGSCSMRVLVVQFICV
jgi:hypothetical protein